MPNTTAGWSVWAKLNNVVRKFVVATASEQDAIALLKKAYPGLDVLSRHTMAPSTIKFFNMRPNAITEWVSADKKPISVSGVPIDKPMR